VSREELDAHLDGVDLFGKPLTEAPSGQLVQKFGTSPFSVLDARAGEWQDRKRAWLRIGIKSEVGRAGNLLKFSDTVLAAQARKGHREFGEEYEGGDAWAGAGTSVFDPVLCERAYDWWAKKGGQVVDPFAGGSVRGVVAASMGRQYWGCDLRQEQVEANRGQLHVLPTGAPVPEWVCGDALDMLPKAPSADFIFSCPPYGDLERYSDDPRDLSTMDFVQFLEAYRRIIALAYERLGWHRFACFVVGDYRDARGYLRDFAGATIRAWREAGAKYYSRGVLVTPAGSAAIRATRIFDGGRKLVPVHQDVLLFVKGDPAVASASVMAGPSPEEWESGPPLAVKPMQVADENQVDMFGEPRAKP
jgi:hypothetical protein